MFPLETKIFESRNLWGDEGRGVTALVEEFVSSDKTNYKPRRHAPVSACLGVVPEDEEKRARK
jgi:hypothetical protein